MKPTLNRVLVSLLILSGGIPGSGSAIHARKKDDIEFENTIRIDSLDSKEEIIRKAAHVVPLKRQLDAMDREFIAFIHFGPNTFTGKEWGNGLEAADAFSPTGLDTDQMVSSLKDAGMKMVILTVKHHDGYVLWQSRYTDHGVMKSDWLGGQGDVLRDLAASCAKYGMKLGIYLSPADLYQIESPEGLYGNLSAKTPRTIPRPVEGRPFENKTTFEFTVDDYNEYFLNQLFELLTEYGPIDEVWFDGAHPKRKGGQTYDYNAWKKLIRTLAPDAVVFGREDLRWCGNEAGRTRETEWNVVTYAANPDTLTRFHDMTPEDLGSRERLYEGRYLHYQPAETDVSIRNGWFYRNDDEQKVRTADDVFDIYERSVGGNSILLLNVPPNKAGRFAKRDSLVLADVGRRIRSTYSESLIGDAKGPRKLLDRNPATSVSASKPLILQFRQPVTFNRLELREPVGVSGERVERHSVEARVNGEWKPLAAATNIGHKRILRFPEVTADAVRIAVEESRLEPFLSEVAAYLYVQPEVDYDVTPGQPELLPKTGWTISESSSTIGHSAAKSSDGDPSTWWQASTTAGPCWLQIDLGEERNLKGLVYTPQTSERGLGMIEQGRVMVSSDGKTWEECGAFEFGNLVNDPVARSYRFPSPVKTRFVRIEPTATALGNPWAAIAEIDLF